MDDDENNNKMRTVSALTRVNCFKRFCFFGHRNAVTKK